MELSKNIKNNDIATAAKLITIIENNRNKAAGIIKDIFLHTGNAYIIGVTGSPGVGKSTLVGEMINIFRKKNLSVGVIAVDSSSPFSGGAILGDRIRMQKHESDSKGVFVRSMATRGNLGGLAKATRDATYIMDAMGRDIIIIETVGVGQVELDIVKLAYTSVVVLAPGMGDDIQAMTAGIMEIGDIFVVNKADHPGADDAEREIKYMLHIGMRKSDWEPEIIKTVAAKGSGIKEFVEKINKHKKYLEDNNLIDKKKYSQDQLIKLIKEKLELRIIKNENSQNIINDFVEKIAKREIDPYSAAENILKKLGLVNRS